MELSLPGSPFLSGDYQMYNVIVTAHAFIMIFLCAIVLYLASGVYLPSGVGQPPVNQPTYLWGVTNIGEQSTSVKTWWGRTRNSEKSGRGMNHMARLLCQTRVTGRITWPDGSRGYSNLCWLGVPEEYAPKVSQQNHSTDVLYSNEREPKWLERRKYGTLGSSKGLKVLDDGVAIVPAQVTSRNLNTSAVMRAKRKVPQQITPLDLPYLETGLAKLNGLALESLSKKLKIWDFILDPELHRIAYASIKGNQGSMTPSTDGETLDGMSLEKIKTTINQLKDHTYQFKPTRRVYIPKKNGKLRPLGIPAPVDKIVQKVIAIVLEAIYDNGTAAHFHESSHGFRRGRGTHTALQEISRWTGADWFIEGDIKSYFDKVNHKRLEEILSKKIDDKQFFDLYWKAVRAEYVDLVAGKREIGNIAVPQGGVLSPILSNIYLHELDCFVQGIKEQEEAKNIPVVIDNPRYKEVHNSISNKRQTIKRTRNEEKKAQLLAEVQSLEKIRASLPSKNTNFDTFQLWYCRYADDFVIGIRGSRKAAEEVLAKVKTFLKDDLYLELNDEKTLVTDVKKKRAHFLGAEIRSLTSRTHHGKKTTRNYAGGKRKVRVPSGKMIILAPIEKIVKKLEDQGICKVINFANRNIIPQRKTAWVNLPEHHIVLKYNQVWIGLLNYYSFAWNRSQLNLIQYLLLHSLACTLMNKLKINSRRQVFQRYGGDLRVSYVNDKSEKKSIGFKLHPNLGRINQFSTDPADPFIPFYYNLRTKDRLGDVCRICSSGENVEMHHIRALKEGKGKNTFANIMRNMNRKQIPVCRPCHNRIHRGEYDGIRLSLRDIRARARSQE